MGKPTNETPEFTTSEPGRLREVVERWIAGEPDPKAAAQLRMLMDGACWESLAELFAGRLAFGTAGLRAEVGPGPLRMNRAVVAQTTAGLCRYLSEASVAGSICIGFDARPDSRTFAHEAAAIAAGAGFRVHLFDALAPTPLVAFAARQLGAAAGIVITASHNPPQYNGYKVYGDDGAQIAPPHDVSIAKAIQQVGPANRLPRMSLAQAELDGRLQRVGSDLEQAYLQAVSALLPPVTAPGLRRLRIAYTALHGVGASLMLQALGGAGFCDVHSVPTQSEPDGSFPTVAFPNPEEPGAMDQVLALADASGADVALAHDPDADRLAVAARDAAGRMVAFTGNEVAALLCDDRLRNHCHDRGRPLVVSTIVTTPMLGALAQAHGARWEQTLTGFKWIEKRALELGSAGYTLALGCEEALGYAFGDAVRDKDGIAAGLLVADLADRCQVEGRTLWEQLKALQARHGVYTSSQTSLALTTPEARARVRERLDAMRSNPPQQLAGLAVREFTDLTKPAEERPEWARALPCNDTVFYALEGDHRIAIRPSGTEPKLKLYIDVREPLDVQANLEVARQRAQHLLETLRADMIARLS